MLLFSPPRCDGSRGSGLGKRKSLTSVRFSISPWLRDPPLVAPSPSPYRRVSQPSLSSKLQPLSQSTPMNMAYSSSPWAPQFSPTLGSIPEVFEYEPIETLRATPNEDPETPEVIAPESSNIAKPKLSRANSRKAIIQSPPRRITSAFSVSKVLRKVLDADLMRRRCIMRVYLKAIIFLKYIWRANERYGNSMLNSGIYVPR